MAEPTDGDLVGATRAGDGSAYSTLVARYQGHVHGLAHSVAGNWADAQDIAQETFIRAYVNLNQLRDPARFAPWLRRVAFGVAMNWLKAFRPGFFRQIEGQMDLDSLEIPDFAPGPAEVAERRELADAVQRAIASLPAKYRVPLTMFHLNGLSYRTVARFLDVPLGTVQSLIHRAREKLRVALGSYYSEEVLPMVQEVFNEHKLPPEFSRNVWNLEYDVRGFGDLLALRACLAQAGAEVDWDDLLGYSGDAFSCDGMSYFSLRGHDVLTEAARSYGFAGRWGFGDDQAHRDLLASLAKKQPCITAGFDGRCLWWVVVIAERAEQNEFLIAGSGSSPKWIATPTRDSAQFEWVGQCPWTQGARTYPDGTPENWQPCPRFMLGDRGETPAPPTRFTNALRLALTSHRREEFAYHFGGGEKEVKPIGRGYLRQWPLLLREWSELRGWSETGDREPLDDCDPDPPPCYRDAYFAPVAHGMRRRAAATFLRSHATEVPDQVRVRLEAAAKHYERSAAAADRIFDALCLTEAVAGLDWYRRLLVGPSYLGERDEAGVAAAAVFAKNHPDRWAARQAILRQMHECLQDASAVEEACQAAEAILREDDAAIANIEKALAAMGCSKGSA